MDPSSSGPEMGKSRITLMIVGKKNCWILGHAIHSITCACPNPLKPSLTKSIHKNKKKERFNYIFSPQ